MNIFGAVCRAAALFRQPPLAGAGALLGAPMLALALWQTPAPARPPAPRLPPLAAGAHDPVFTTYAAPLERSEYLVDEGYHLRFEDPGAPVAFTTDSAGDLAIGFVRELDKIRTTLHVGDFTRAPIVRQSLADFVRFDFEPFPDLRVDAAFVVYSSRDALLELRFTNAGKEAQRFHCFASEYSPPDGIGNMLLPNDRSQLFFAHTEPREAWSESPPPAYENVFHDLLVLDRRANGLAVFPRLEGPPQDPEKLGKLPATPVRPDRAGQPGAGVTPERSSHELRIERVYTLAAGETDTFRVVRAVAPQSENRLEMPDRVRPLLAMPLQDLEREAAAPYANAPVLTLNRDRELIYRGALSLARQSMLPAEGGVRHPYYVFSREPTWGWGHDGQVFHESLSMLAYAYLDPAGAMESQRVFMDAQQDDGYIPYRIGPYAVRTFPVNGEKTTSAPFFSWTNWEVYRIARDKARRGESNATLDEATRFLDEAYRAGARFAEFVLAHRDRDRDGLLEWGGNAVLESVRDSQVPLWDALGKSDPSAPSRLEALDLSAMMVKELHALRDMARALGRAGEAARWDARADVLGRRINETMWDRATGFYYNVDRDTNRFVTPGGVDLRRKEIIGFLPLWAGVASREQAGALIRHLTDPREFWRRYGVPTLAADDPAYQPAVTRCCQWNGAVWLEWNYLVFDGLRRYGRPDLARDLADRMIAAAATQLRANHHFWESYSPDQAELGSPDNYIWDSLLARVLIDLDGMRR